MKQQSNPMEPVDHLSSGLRSLNDSKNKRRRSMRTRRQHDEDMNLIQCLVNLARVPEPNAESKKKKRKKVVVEQVPSSSSPHTCKVCNKSFKSGQALRGHVSSHKQKRPVDAVPDQDRISHQDDHKCSVCGDSFETGQALGGHMRRHYNQPGVNSQTGDDADAEKGRVRDLNLNLPPP